MDERTACGVELLDGVVPGCVRRASTRTIGHPDEITACRDGDRIPTDWPARGSGRGRGVDPKEPAGSASCRSPRCKPDEPGARRKRTDGMRTDVELPSDIERHRDLCGGRRRRGPVDGRRWSEDGRRPDDREEQADHRDTAGARGEQQEGLRSRTRSRPQCHTSDAIASLAPDARTDASAWSRMLFSALSTTAAIAIRRLEASFGDTAVALRDGHIEPGLDAAMSEDS